MFLFGPSKRSLLCFEVYKLNAKEIFFLKVIFFLTQMQIN